MLHARLMSTGYCDISKLSDNIVNMKGMMVIKDMTWTITGGWACEKGID